MLPTGAAHRRRRCHSMSSVSATDASSIEELQLLQRAARKGRHDLVASLIMNGADINATDSNGHTAAHQAARNGRVKVLEVLHALGADLNKCSVRGVSIAHQAAFGGHLDFLQRLLDFDVRVDLVDANDLTPLEVAIKEKRWHVVEYLESIYSQLELPPSAPVPTLDQELMTMLNAPPLDLSSPSPKAALPMLSSSLLDGVALPHSHEMTHPANSADEMHKSSLRLHSLLSFTHDGLDDEVPDLVLSTPSPPRPPNCRKRSAAALDLPTTPESSMDGDAGPLPSTTSSHRHDHPLRPTALHMVSLPPIASPSSWQVKTMPKNPQRSTAVAWRGTKHRVQGDHRPPDAAEYDGDLGLETVHNLLYDM